MGSKARKRKCEIERVTEKVGENVGSREREFTVKKQIPSDT